MDAPRLPHRYPFAMVEDRAGPSRVRFSADDARCRNLSEVPQWALVEAFAQAAGLSAFGPGSGGSLVQVNRFRCPRPARPGDELHIAVAVVRRMGPLLRVRVTARREGRLLATAALTLREEAAP